MFTLSVWSKYVCRFIYTVCLDYVNVYFLSVWCICLPYLSDLKMYIYFVCLVYVNVYILAVWCICSPYLYGQNMYIYTVCLVYVNA